jgi:hypothetical protein
VLRQRAQVDGVGTCFGTETKLHHRVPLALHGDGVPVIKDKRLYVISVVALLRIGITLM